MKLKKNAQILKTNTLKHGIFNTDLLAISGNAADNSNPLRWYLFDVEFWKGNKHISYAMMTPTSPE